MYELGDDSSVALSPPAATPAFVSCCDIDVTGDKLCDSSTLTGCALEEFGTLEVSSVGRSLQEHSGRPSSFEKSCHSDIPFMELCASHASQTRLGSLPGSHPLFTSAWLVGASG